MSPRRWTAGMAAAALLAGLLAALPVRAGQACQETALPPASVQKAFRLALKTRDSLEQRGARVALLARVGRDLSEYRLRYSHIGFVFRDHPKGRWMVVHQLNECDSAQSTLYDEGLANFFLDNMFAYDALVLIPDERLQERLIADLAAKMPGILHEPHYNLVSFAFSTKYQNSNQWLLEVMARAAADPADDPVQTRSDAQAWLREQRFRPTTLQIPTLKRLGARMFRANVAFDDHPFDRRMAGQIDVVTVESVAEFAEQRGWIKEKFVLTAR